MLVLESLPSRAFQRRILTAVAALAVTAACTGCSLTRSAVGQDNGTLQSTYVSTSFRTAPEVHRTEAAQVPTSALLNHHDYAPIAR